MMVILRNRCDAVDAQVRLSVKLEITHFDVGEVGTFEGGAA